MATTSTASNTNTTIEPTAARRIPITTLNWLGK
jgi:hypothetical protein